MKTKNRLQMIAELEQIASEYLGFKTTLLIKSYSKQRLEIMLVGYRAMIAYHRLYAQVMDQIDPKRELPLWAYGPGHPLYAQYNIAQEHLKSARSYWLHSY